MIWSDVGAAVGAAIYLGFIGATTGAAVAILLLWASADDKKRRERRDKMTGRWHL